MANRVKTISKYSGSAWGTEVPIGADATNVDMTTAPSDYDSSTSETSKTLIGTNDVKVIASDTDLTAWGKFNRFRRRVSNKFADYFATANVKTSYQTTGANGDVYSTSLLNSYFSNVIGYTGSSAPTAGSVASQLESLNSKSWYLNVSDWTTITQLPYTAPTHGYFSVRMAPSESTGKYLYLTTSNGPQINLNSTGGMNVTSGMFVSEGTTIALSSASSKIAVTYRFRTVSVSTGADS